MRTYGETLRNIRKQKGITLKQLAHNVCAVSFLSKFERADSDITITLMEKLLENLMMSFDEFIYIHQNYESAQLEQFFHQVEDAYLKQDLEQLIKLKNDEMNKWAHYQVETYRYNSLLLQVHISHINPLYKMEDVQQCEIDELANYLFRVERWSYYEFALYNGTLLLLEGPLVVALSKLAYEKWERYKAYPIGQNIIIRTLTNTLIYLLGPVDRYNETFIYKKEFIQFVTYLENILNDETNLIGAINLKMILAAYEIRLGKKQLGIKKMSEVLDLLEQLDATKTAENWKQYMSLITAT